MTDLNAARPAPRSRGGGIASGLYALAFLFLLVAGGILAFEAKELFRTTVKLWVSAGFSVVAIVLAVVSLLVGRRP